ncbi:Transposon Tf2-8 polyprotein [Dictyocoela muelleri]|nr:Transposon Tf2-8 polyprotein [Dictyocoela muelleri]
MFDKSKLLTMPKNIDAKYTTNDVKDINNEFLYNEFLHIHRSLIHPGPQSMISTISRYIKFPGMGKIIREISKNCLKYNLEKTTKTNYGETQAINIKKNVNESLNIDIKGPIRRIHFNTNNKLECFYIIVMTDYCSRYTEISVQNKVTSKIVITAIINKWISKYGCPKEIFSDNGRQFISTEFKNFFI